MVKDIFAELESNIQYISQTPLEVIAFKTSELLRLALMAVSRMHLHQDGDLLNINFYEYLSCLSTMIKQIEGGFLRKDQEQEDENA